jgi:hypothetical protein
MSLSWNQRLSQRRNRIVSSPQPIECPAGILLACIRPRPPAGSAGSTAFPRRQGAARRDPHFSRTGLSPVGRLSLLSADTGP